MNCNDFNEVPVELLAMPRIVKVNMCGNPFILPHIKTLDFKAYKQLSVEDKVEGTLLPTTPSRRRSLFSRSPYLAPAWEKEQPEYEQNGVIEQLEQRLCICRHIPAATDLPDRILPKLYLGSQACALNRHILKHLGITHILTLLDLRPAYPEVSKYR